ncbi:unnamed protein product [Prunus armeniaca]|uniref:Uncharacterized protein n=1 Tax=Prunus armeniaca TaxID=36596 RepID=A0A6J5WLC3_PRUAR|nr:unnamed protein product [Prunus armeniaca]
MAAVNHFYVLNVGMNINLNFNVIYLFNNLNLQLRNTLYDHDILAFIIPTLLTLVQIRYPADQDLFQTRYTPYGHERCAVKLACLLLGLQLVGAKYKTLCSSTKSCICSFLVPYGHEAVWFSLVAAAAGLAPETGDHHKPTFAATREDSQYWDPLHCSSE